MSSTKISLMVAVIPSTLLWSSSYLFLQYLPFSISYLFFLSKFSLRFSHLVEIRAEILSYLAKTINFGKTLIFLAL